jgi:RNA polymerase sigma factor (sigma-70 family)
LLAARLDCEAFGRFYDRNNRLVIAYFQRRVACGHVAAELTAETFAAALAGHERLRGTGRAWLFGIAGNQFRQWLRRGKVEHSSLQRLGMTLPAVQPSDVERIEALVDFAVVVPELRSALDGLSDAVRAAVHLRVVCQLPYAEIANRLGCSEGSARVRVARGLGRLAASLEAPG